MDCKTENLDGNRIASEMFAKVFRAYMECSDEVQGAIREMVEIVTADDASEDEKDAALSTIEDALFPATFKGDLGVDLDDADALSQGECKSIYTSLKLEEGTFADRLNAAMEDRNITQAELAQKIGVGQPAISMILSRDCRPQRRTVQKIATAIGVPVEELWPGFQGD